MITGAHTILYSSNPEADRNFLLKVLNLTNVDIGHGWLIFGLPPKTGSNAINANLLNT